MATCRHGVWRGVGSHPHQLGALPDCLRISLALSLELVDLVGELHLRGTKAKVSEGGRRWAKAGEGGQRRAKA